MKRKEVKKGKSLCNYAGFMTLMTSTATLKLPKRLYKYRAFNVNTLRLLSEAEVYYANPANFNDPLDCKPTIQVDTDRSLLEKLCYKMLVASYGKERALREMRNHRYMSTEYGDYKVDAEVEKYYMQRLASNIKDLLYAEMGNCRVLSLAERWDCPLMWSHYADKHRGLCLEYDMADHACRNMKAVDYKQPRSIKINDLVAWKLNGSTAAAQVIHNTFFFAKAPQWRYEREWRDINGSSGASSAPFRISAIYFGLRCDTAVLTTLVKLYADVNWPIKFYNVYPLDESFRLKRRLVDTAEIEAIGLKSSALLDFKDIFIDPMPS